MGIHAKRRHFGLTKSPSSARLAIDTVHAIYPPVEAKPVSVNYFD